jgi:hypothetical protein
MFHVEHRYRVSGDRLIEEIIRSRSLKAATASDYPTSE